MQRITDQTVEERFGLAVADHRRVIRLSQKALAEHLTEHGLPLDASAISRIEKGTRALRLSEAAAIASTLGFDLSDIEHPYNPAKRFNQRRKMVDNGLAAATEGILQLGNALEEMSWVLQEQGMRDQMLGTLEHPGLDHPTDMTSYVRWVTARWLEGRDESAPYQEMLDEEAEAARELIAAMARTLIRGVDE